MARKCKTICYDDAAGGGGGGGGGANDAMKALNDFEKHVRDMNNPHQTSVDNAEGDLGVAGGPRLVTGSSSTNGDIWVSGGELSIRSAGKTWRLTGAGWVSP